MGKMIMSQCSKIVEDIKKRPHPFRSGFEGTMSDDDKDHLIEMIKGSHKFIIGDIESIPEFDVSHLGDKDLDGDLVDLFKMPYKNTIFEYVDCTDGGGRVPIIVMLREDDGVTRLSCFLRQNKYWFMERFVFDYDCNDRRISISILDIEGVDLESGELNINKCQSNMSLMTERILSILAVINCSNVIVKNNTIPDKLQQKRIKNNKLPFFEYKTLHIKRSGVVNKKKRGTGSHASPRLHFRRGHIRRLPSGKTTWVTECLVGDKKKGFVGKNYSLDK